jgi:hypothetical protein
MLKIKWIKGWLSNEVHTRLRVTRPTWRFSGESSGLEEQPSVVKATGVGVTDDETCPLLNGEYVGRLRHASHATGHWLAVVKVGGYLPR